MTEPSKIITLAQQNHVAALITFFGAWKILLLCVACVSPGPGYDTSAELLLPLVSQHDPVSAKILTYVSSKLVRWDALYFIRVAQRGYLFEQEWAWGWGFTKLISSVARVIAIASPELPLLAQALAGILIAHVFHLLSVLVLYALALHILPSRNPQRTKTAFIASVLHIISPAGVFLSAPYSESVFSCLTFLGMLLYCQGFRRPDSKQPDILELASILGSGLCWGLASTIRGNGLFNGIVIAYRSVVLLRSLPKPAAFARLVANVIAGVLVALGTILPQWIAYKEYCLDSAIGKAPIWCSQIPPSIYTWVQAHYWNVGFLRYWTLSNVPLFLLAIPVLCLMLSTALVAIIQPNILLPAVQNPKHRGSIATPTKLLMDIGDEERFVVFMRCLSLPQAVLAILTLTNFHVQIINRISSGYPMWYIFLAIMFTSRSAIAKEAGSSTTRAPSPNMLSSRLVALLTQRSVQHLLVSSTLLYGLIQAGLYASFLPPA